MDGVVQVYLSGSIKKGDADNRSPDHFWTEADEAVLHTGVVGAELRLLNPAKTPIQRSDYRANFGCDLFLVQQSDIVLVDARREKGIGIGAEMMFAANASIPVIAWAPGIRTIDATSFLMFSAKTCKIGRTHSSGASQTTLSTTSTAQSRC